MTVLGLCPFWDGFKGHFRGSGALDVIGLDCGGGLEASAATASFTAVDLVIQTGYRVLSIWNADGLFVPVHTVSV